MYYRLNKIKAQSIFDFDLYYRRLNAKWLIFGGER